MKKYLIVTLAIFISNLAMAQHYENQVKFKNNAVVRTPRYRTQNNVSQEETPRVLADNEIELKCSALMNVKADSYLAIFNLTQVATTAKEADELINKRIQLFFDNLKNLGLSPSDFYVDMVYLIPVFEFEVSKKFFSKTYNEVPKGFEMQKNVHIKFKGANMIDKIVTTASLSEIYDLVTVEYFVNNPSAIYDSLRTAAHRYLRSNVARLKTSGVNLSEHFSALQEETDVVYPESRYSDYEAFVTQSLEAARNTTVTTVRKPKTVAYNKLAYDEFDVVINAEFTEPVVQYTYELTMKYILPDKQGNKNKYFIIDSNGNLKEVPLK
ncbi:MAG: SIMPL domain-containing protein [Chryseolinea sp.]